MSKKRIMAYAHKKSDRMKPVFNFVSNTDDSSRLINRLKEICRRKKKNSFSQ